jgi:hypothetical protein
LRRRVLDAVLLHNPEHYFKREASEIVRRASIRLAFEVLEEQVAKGKIGCYGISSNALSEPNSMSIEEWVELARSVKANHSFCIVQFPFNLMESQAATISNGESLIQKIHRLGLRSMGNRPLTSQGTEGPIRLANYGLEDLPICDRVYEDCVGFVQQQLTTTGIPHAPMDFMVMQFLRDNRHGISHPDLVDEIFLRHVYPFVEHLWNREVNADGPRQFALLHTVLRHGARRALSQNADIIRAGLVEKGIIEENDPRPLAQIACEFGLRSGLDHVVVGMRLPEYVDILRPLFSR